METDQVGLAGREDQASVVDHTAAGEADRIVADRMAAGHTAAEQEGRHKETEPAVQGAGRTVAEQAGHIAAAEEVVRMPVEEAVRILVEEVGRKEFGRTVAAGLAVGHREKEQQRRGREPVQGTLKFSESVELLQAQRQRERQRQVPEWFEVY